MTILNFKSSKKIQFQCVEFIISFVVYLSCFEQSVFQNNCHQFTTGLLFYNTLNVFSTLNGKLCCKLKTIAEEALKVICPMKKIFCEKFMIVFNTPRFLMLLIALKFWQHIVCTRTWCFNQPEIDNVDNFLYPINQK